MKKIVIVAAIAAVVFAGCKSSSDSNKVFEQPIKDYVKDQALGIDLKYKSLDMNVTDTVTFQETIDRLVASYGCVNADTLLSKMHLYFNLTTDYKVMLTNAYQLNSYQNCRLIKLLKIKDKKAVNYYVIKNKYQITNPMLDNAQIECNVTFLADSNYHIIRSISKYELDRERLDSNSLGLFLDMKVDKDK